MWHDSDNLDCIVGLYYTDELMTRATNGGKYVWLVYLS